MSRSLALFGVFLCSAQPALADVELPLLHEVTKTIAFTEDVPPQDLLRFKEVRHLVLEIHLLHGNMVRDSLIELLNTAFPSVTKRFVLAGKLLPAHITQFKKIKGLEVALTLHPDYARSELAALDELGPVRKHIVIPAELDLQSLGRLKIAVPIFTLKDRLDERITRWIESRKNRSVRFVLGPEVPPALAYDLLRFKPLALEIATVKNRIPPPLLAVLRDLRGVSLTIVVDGRLTLEDVLELTQFEDFSLKVNLTQSVDVIPGFPALLNRVAPP